MFRNMSMDASAEKDVMNGGSGLKTDEKTDEVVEVDAVDSPYIGTTQSGVHSNDSGSSQFNSIYRPQRTDSPRNIRITGFEERKARIQKYHVYIIEVEPAIPNVINVARRFNDFRWLRQRLCERFPGVFVPPLPPAKILGRYESDFVAERMKDLERFLNRIEEIKSFSESVELRMFLSRPESTIAEGKKEISEQFESRTVDVITKDLIDLFPDLANNSLSENHSSHDVPRLIEFLTKVETSMKTLEVTANKLFSNLVNVATEMNTFSDAFDNLYIAESNYPYKPNIERFDLRKEFEGWKEFQDKQTDIYYKLFLRTLRHEHEDIVAFLELFKYRDGIELSYNKFKKNCEKWQILENNGSTLQPKQIDQKEKDTQNEKEYYQHLEIVTKIILHSEMPVIWKHKTNNWRKHILQFAQHHAKETEKMMQTWKNMQTQ